MVTLTMENSKKIMKQHKIARVSEGHIQMHILVVPKGLAFIKDKNCLALLMSSLKSQGLLAVSIPHGYGITSLL